MSWCCVASPQSKSQISSVRRSAYELTLRVNEGEPELVPRNVSSMPLKLLSASSETAEEAEEAEAGRELNIVRWRGGAGEAEASEAPEESVADEDEPDELEDASTAETSGTPRASIAARTRSTSSGFLPSALRPARSSSARSSPTLRLLSVVFVTAPPPPSASASAAPGVEAPEGPSAAGAAGATRRRAAGRTTGRGPGARSSTPAPRAPTRGTRTAAPRRLERDLIISSARPARGAEPDERAGRAPDATPRIIPGTRSRRAGGAER